MTFVLGLTGSIGMGKVDDGGDVRAAGVRCTTPTRPSTPSTARGGAADRGSLPGTTPGVVDRPKLSAAVLGDAAAISRLEAIVHPLVAARRDEFIARARKADAALVVLDIPLLFETGGEGLCDAVAVSRPRSCAKGPRPVSRGDDPGALRGHPRASGCLIR